MKRIVFAALVVFLVANAAAYAAERPTLRKAIEAKQVDLWENVAKRQLPKPIPQWCEYSCSNECLDQWNACQINCQLYWSVTVCDPYCYQHMRNCMCVNQCCHEPLMPGEDYCS